MLHKLVLTNGESILDNSNSRVNLRRGRLLCILPVIIKTEYVESLVGDPSGLSNRYWTKGRKYHRVFTPLNKNYKDLKQQFKIK